MPVISLPAISPSNNSSPGFSVIKYSTTEATDISYYYLDLFSDWAPTFSEFNLRNELNIPNFKPTSLELFLNWRDSSEFDARQFMKMYSGRINYNLQQMKSQLELDDTDLKMIFCTSYIIDSSEADSLCKLK